MPFEYLGMNGLQDQTIDYSANPFPVQEQQDQGGGMSMQGLDMLGGGAGGGVATGSTSAPAGAMMDLGAGPGATGQLGGGGAAGGGGSSWMAAAGPWAALAAIIIGNESEAKKGGYRDEDTGDYIGDIATGEVLTQDLEQRWLPKIFGEDLENDVTGLGGDTLMGSQLASFKFSDAWDSFKNDSSLSKIFDIF